MQAPPASAPGLVESTTNSSSASTSVQAKERDQRIQSARKKLKSYRAKQAAVEKKRVSILAESIAPSESSSSISRLSVTERPSSLLGKRLSSGSSSAIASTSSPRASTQSTAPPSTAHTRSSSNARHARGHSRNGSISFSALSPSPASLLFSTPLPASPAPVSANEIPQSAPARSASTAFVASTPHTHTRGHSRSGSRARSGYRPASLLFTNNASGSQQTQPLAVGEWRDVDDKQKRAEASATVEPAASHARRPSRHSRQVSVSTRRESMEIMGGLNAGTLAVADNAPGSVGASPRRHSRQMSSNRHSGILSASLLFGGSSTEGTHRASRASGIHKNELDWRTFGAVQEAAASEDSSDRLTALEKLEGRSRSTSPAATRDHVSADNAYNDRHSRPSSVQLPSFDDVHGTDAMDKRKSTSLLEANEASTSADEPLGSNSRSSLTSLLTNSTYAEGAANARPSSIRIGGDAAPVVEGLGTLMEEEEEEDESAASSPVRERSLDLGSEETQRKRRERAEEQETVKRNRRASLNPNPFKLKSRPASLYVGTLKSSKLGNASGLSASGSLPHLAAISGEDEDEELESSVDEKSASSTPRSGATTAPKEWALASAQQKLASARADVTHRQQTAAVTPETKRSWRSSMPSAAALTSSSVPAPPATGSAPATRQGMRTLRLGSFSSEHKGPSDSVSSIASNATASSTSMSMAAGSVPIGRRQSLVLSTAPDVSQGVPSVVREGNGPSPATARRSSIHYKSSSPTPASAPATVGTSAASSPSPLSQPPVQPATAAPTGVSSFQRAQYDELKATHRREHSLLEASRKQVERLAHELVVEKERSAREYAELESWSAEEKRTLGARIEHLEQAATASANSAMTRETELLGRLETVETELKGHVERLEDIEAERDMLQEDIDGWRTRCSDLEKSVRTERMAADEERRANVTAKLRIQSLIQKLEDAAIEVPRPNADETFEDGLPVDLVSVLRSPALGSVSPVVQQTGYFTPNPAADPTAPPPQAIKLLKEMRQQIFNLAGTLEHERAEHLRAKAELEALKEENARLRGESTLNTTVSSGETESAGHSSAGSPPRRASATQKTTPTGKTKRHVFAYDSSMGSTSMGSGSVAAGTASTVPSEYDHGGSEDHSKENEDLLLGLGGLQTLAESEEEEQHSDAARTPLARPQSVGEAPDLEAGGSYDTTEDSSSLPDLEHSTPVRGASEKVVPAIALDGKRITPTASHSSCSSTESSHGPASPRTSYEQELVEAVNDDYDESDADDEEEEAMKRDRSAKPEFIREWSFETAMSSIAARRQRKASARGQTPRSAPAAIEGKTKPRSTRPRRRRQQSSDDFFGLLALDGSEPLPALPTPDEALEMPPFYVEQSSRGSYAGTKRRSVESYDHSPRVSMRVSSGPPPPQQRPPVAKSAYAHAQMHESADAAAAAGGVLSRMSLGGLTSAFSGLGGYLLSGQSGAVQAAAAATKACAGSGSITPNADPLLHHQYGGDSGLDSPQSSFSWATTRRLEDGEEPPRNDQLSSDPWAQHHLAQMRQQQQRAW